MSAGKWIISASIVLSGLIVIGSGHALSETNTTRRSPSGSDAGSSPQQSPVAEIRLASRDSYTNDFFGRAVAISGDTLVIGANGIDIAGDRAGAAYVFQWNGSAWAEQARLFASDAEASDEFGRAVAIDRDIVAVGAPAKRSAISGNGAGAVYVFERSGNQWIERAKLVAADGAPFDLFGQALAIGGETIAVGAQGADDPAGARNSGAVYVFQRSGEKWAQQVKLIGDGVAADYFGHAVAIGGDTLVVGAYGHNGNAGNNSGVVYIFQRDGASWIEQARLTASDAKAYAQFGYAIALDGDTLVVGADQDSDAVAKDPLSFYNNGGMAGAVYVFQRDGGAWREEAKFTVTGPEMFGFFGRAVAVTRRSNGNTIVAAGGWGMAALRIYQRGGTGWAEPLTISPEGANGLLATGETIAAAGDRLILGARGASAPGADESHMSTGAAYVFDLATGPQAPPPTPEPTSTPQPLATLSIEKTRIEPIFTGKGVALGRNWSPDGDWLVLTTSEQETQSGRLINALSYLNARTGAMCPFPGTFKHQINPRDHTAWLPDGRSLIVTDRNEVVLHTPCEVTFDTISDRFADTIVNVAASRADRTALLLRGRDAFWLYDPATQTARPIDGVTPGATADDRWDSNGYAWSPDGEQVAIIAQGSPTLHLVDVNTGRVARTIPLAAPDEDRAPLMEWLTNDHLLVWGFSNGGPSLLTLGAGEAQTTIIIPELFGLDIDYPNGLWGMGGYGDEATGVYHLIMARDAPEDRTIYIFHSETQTVERLPFEQSTLLLLPPDDTMWAFKYDETFIPSAPNVEGGVETMLVYQVDSGRAATPLVIEGHLPREYLNPYVARWIERNSLIVTSSQGISLISLSNGKTLKFWGIDLQGVAGSPGVLISPDGKRFVVQADTMKQGFPESYGDLYIIETPD